jgi:acyl dehydratase
MGPHSIGECFTTRGRTVTESDLVQFSGLTWDVNLAHTDAVAAAELPFGERVAHGTLVMSLALGLAVIDGPRYPWRAGLSLSWQFVRPVRIGDTIHTEWTIAAVSPTKRDEVVRVTSTCRVINQDGELVQEGDVVRLAAASTSSEEPTT